MHNEAARYLRQKPSRKLTELNGSYFSPLTALNGS